ncbi:MAG TPA: expansin EXLX1 family cellulose-binding protein [Kofleriaceae bacterium]|nr:expansin EXLX1 family cellulose-binding protein [Kofleriaceae bacterium]
MRVGWIVLALAGCGGCGHSHDASDGGAAGSCTPIPAAESGSGTYYDADGTGNCSFDASPSDLMVAAMNAADYGDATWCGACLAVTGPMGTVTVRVVDQCPGCSHGDLDLSPQAFQMLSPLSAGRIPITWHEVDCNVTGPIAYYFKDGSNQYWTAIQIRNARYPIATVEAQVDGAWASIQRLDYNYFVQATGLGPGPYSLRVTDQRGQQLGDSGIALGASIGENGSGQFASCP